MAPALPPHIAVALDRLTEGLSRQVLAQRAAKISQSYRSGGTSAVIANADDALAYALVRMPATYAAVAACLDAVRQARPEFAPRTLIDIGAGPGTATFAASTAFASLDHFRLTDSNAQLRRLALDLIGKTEPLRRADYHNGTARAFLNGVDAADLVIASYMIGEIEAGERAALVDLMWQSTRDTLILIEPGTPDGYARIIACRDRLIAAGAHVTAPCPHDRACALVAPDWCHFAQRLPRSRDHKLLKGAEVPFEDEKFSYVVLSRAAAGTRASRVLAPPDQSKVAITAKLCTADGIVAPVIQRRDKAGFAKARRWRWGDGI